MKFLCVSIVGGWVWFLVVSVTERHEEELWVSRTLGSIIAYTASHKTPAMLSLICRARVMEENIGEYFMQELY